VFLHTGTLAVVIFYFRHDVKMVLTALVQRDFHSEYGVLIPLIIVATIPTGIIGLLYNVFLADSYQTFLIMGVTFIFGAVLLFSSRFGKENQTQISYRKALLIGAAQGAAGFPGLSRSGATISIGLLGGVKREMVFKFSFLLSIPAILGDLIVELYLQRGTMVQDIGVNSANLIIGLAITVIVGYFSILLVKRLVLTKRFYNFAFYTFALGLILITLSILGI
jgi:undecaprenyl-diphosphatase